MKTLFPFLLVLLLPCLADADGFRCGTRLVVTGDPVSRLIRACGQPVAKNKAREVLGRGGGTAVAVSNWVYPRGRRGDAIVSVQGGRVVKISIVH